MQQDFEKQVQEKLHDYHLEPSAHVWKDIAVALKTPKRKRRISFAWLFLAAAFIVSGGVWLLDNNFVTKQNVTALKENGSNNNAKVISPNAAIITNQIINSKQSAQLNLSNANQSFASPSKNKQSSQINFDDKLFASSSSNDLITQNNFQQNITSNNSQTLNQENNLHKNFTFNNIEPNAQKFSSVNVAISKENKQKKSKSVWSFLFAGGTTNTTSSNFLFSKKNESIYTTSRGTTDTAKSMRAAYTGFHATVGIQYSLALNPRWTMYTGLQYSFLLNHQRTGPKVIQESEIATTYDTSLAAASHSYTKIDYHYPDGTSALNTNHASWLEMPVGIGYKINPSAKHIKFEVRTGVSVAHMFDNKWLIPDGRYNKFYYSNALTNDMIVNWHGDFVVTLPKNKIIGLQIQHSITSFAKQPVQPSLYWSNISIYTTIPLRK